jgi:hypothetical protein
VVTYYCVCEAALSSHCRLMGVHREEGEVGVVTVAVAVALHLWHCRRD